MSAPTHHTAKDRHGVLGVSAGERVAAGLGQGAFHHGEIRIPHPGTGDAEPQFEKLVDDRAGKAHGQQVIALPLVQTPEDQQAENDEQGLLAQMGDEGEKRIAQGRAQPLEHVQKLHRIPPGCVGSTNIIAPEGQKVHRKAPLFDRAAPQGV